MLFLSLVYVSHLVFVEDKEGGTDFPKSTLERTYSYSGRVLIVGAGASGLAAAEVLEQNHIDYNIIEATDEDVVADFQEE